MVPLPHKGEPAGAVRRTDQGRRYTTNIFVASTNMALFAPILTSVTTRNPGSEPRVGEQGSQ